MKNNFDMNSKGLSIECGVFYDQDNMDFDEYFTRVDTIGSQSLLNNRFWNVDIYAHDDSDFDLLDLKNWKAPTKQKIVDYILFEQYENAPSHHIKEDFKRFLTNIYQKRQKKN